MPEDLDFLIRELAALRQRVSDLERLDPLNGSGYPTLSGLTAGQPLRATGAAAAAFGALDLANANAVTGALPHGKGGSGLSATPSNGQLPIGNGSGYALAALTGTANEIGVTNGSGSITLSGPTRQTYAPTWSGTGSNPAIGDGTISGSYLVIGALVQGFINVTMGSTTTYGTGVYEFTLPTALNSTPRFISAIGHLTDSGTNDYTVGALIDASTGKIRLWTSASPAALVGPTAPFTFANGDLISISFAYLK